MTTINHERAIVGTYKQYLRSLKKAEDLNMLIVMDKDNIDIWYMLVFNIPNEEYSEAEFLCKFTLPAEYPQKPPVFTMLTPNGLYEEYKNPCLSNGHEHPDQYRITGKITEFASSIANSFHDYAELVESRGRHILNTSPEIKKECSKNSPQYNAQHHQKILELFRKLIEEHNIQQSLSFMNNDI